MLFAERLRRARLLATEGPNRDLFGPDVLLWSASARQRLWLPRQDVARPALAEGSFAGHGVNKYGPTARWTRNANGGVDFGTRQPLNSSTGVAVLVVGRLTADTNARFALAQRVSTSNAVAYSVVANRNEAFSAASGAFMLYCRNDAGTPRAVVAESAVDGAQHIWASSNSTTASSGYILRDGVALTLLTNNSLTGTFVNTGQKFRIGNTADYTTDGAFVCDDPLDLILAWPRFIPQQQMQVWVNQIASNPRIVYRPQRIWVPTAAAAGGGTTVAVPTAALTLTAFAPTVLTPRTVSVPTGALTLTGHAPTVLSPRTVAVPTATLTLTALAPNVLTGTTIAVPTAALTMTALAPTVVVTANQLISVPTATLTMTAHAPTVIGDVVSGVRGRLRRRYKTPLPPVEDEILPPKPETPGLRLPSLITDPNEILIQAGAEAERVRRVYRTKKRLEIERSDEAAIERAMMDFF